MENISERVLPDTDLPRLACVTTRDESGDERRDDEEDQVHPVRRSSPAASDQCPNDISLRCKEPSQDNLDERKREHDERLDPVATSLFPRRQRICAHEADLVREVPHDGQHAGDEEHDNEVLHIRQHIAIAISSPPFLHVVVAPDESVHNRQEVLNHRCRDEHHGGELAILVEKTQRNQAYDDRDEPEEYATDEVRSQRGCGVRFVAVIVENERVGADNDGLHRVVHGEQ